MSNGNEWEDYKQGEAFQEIRVPNYTQNRPQNEGNSLNILQHSWEMCHLPVLYLRLIRQIIMRTSILLTLLDKMVETSSNLPLLPRRDNVYRLQGKNYLLLRPPSWRNRLKPALYCSLLALLGRNRISLAHEHMHSLPCSLLAHSLLAIGQKAMVLFIMLGLKLGRQWLILKYHYEK